jgi:diguanylate cyclase (GGDEF)-like protein
VTALSLAAAAIWAVAIASFPQISAPIGLGWPILALLFFGAERFVVDIDVREQTHSFSLSEIAVILAIIFASPADLLLGQVLGAGTALLLRPGQRPIKLLFNLANFALCSVFALLAYRLILGAGHPLEVYGWAAAFTAVFVSDVIGATNVALVIWLSQRERPNLRWLFGFATVYTLISPSIALLGATVLWYAPGVSWLLIALGLMTYVVMRLHGRDRTRHRTLAQLQDSTRQIQQAFGLDDVARALLTTSREMFEAGVAELLLFSESDRESARTMRMSDDVPGHDGATAPAAANGRWVTHRLDPLEGVWARVAAEGRGVLIRESSPATLDRTRLLEALPVFGGRRAATAQRVLDYFHARGIRGAIVAPLRVEDTLVGTLLVGNRRGSVTEWSPADLTLLETLANHAGVALHNSRQADELARQRDELQRRSTHDDLTGLPNRALFNDEIHAAIAGGGNGAVLVLDLDRFKEVNDTLGHHNGDRLLVDAANRLRAGMDESAVVARLGGDEFAVLLRDTDLPGAVTGGHQVLAALRAPFVVHGVTVQVEASIGIALFPSHGTDHATLMRRADVAMYEAKSARTGYSIYEQRRDPYSEARLALLSELRKAVDRDELSVVYQPQAEPRTGKIEGAEALVRWSHPQRGELMPDEFLKLAEHSEVIHSLTRFVLRTAIRQCSEWHAAGFPVRVAVNLSARSLNDSALAADIAAMVKEYGLVPSALELEITETSIEIDPVRTDAFVTAVHDLGVQVAIDDFGTGYSAFAYLQRLPIDEIKIDRSFVMGMDSDRRKGQIVRSTIQLARNMGIRVVAEGVESESVQRQLARQGCDLIQGYLVSRAVSADMLGGLLRRPVRRRQSSAARGEKQPPSVVRIPRSA